MITVILAALLLQAAAPSSETGLPPDQGEAEARDKLRKWGNLTLRTGVSRPAIIKGDPAWWQADDRPGDVSDNVHGRTVINFVIGTDGRISNCEIYESSGNEKLDRRTCDVATRRARFLPELDLDGKPVESHGRRAANW